MKYDAEGCAAVSSDGSATSAVRNVWSLGNHMRYSTEAPGLFHATLFQLS